MINSDTVSTLRGDIALTQLRELQDNLIKLAKEANLNTEEHDALRDPDWIDRVIQKTRAAFTVTVIGQTSSGKSSFINSLLGRRILVPSDSPTDGVIAVLMEAEPDGPECAEWVDTSGAVHDFPSLEVAMRFLRQQETPQDQQLACREVRFFLHEPWLRGLRIVNTPGLGDRLQCFEDVTLRYLREDESDLVVWTFFPDTAGNDLEMGVFGSTLARRKDSVVGIVTRVLEGHQYEDDYDPREDPSLNGPKTRCAASWGRIFGT